MVRMLRKRTDVEPLLPRIMVRLPRCGRQVIAACNRLRYCREEVNRYQALALTQLPDKEGSAV
jgi:hypothetical protein